MRFVPVDDPVRGSFVAEEDVFCNREERDQSQFLMNDDDTFGFAVGNPGKSLDVTLVSDFTVVAAMGIDAAQDFH